MMSKGPAASVPMDLLSFGDVDVMCKGTRPASRSDMQYACKAKLKCTSFRNGLSVTTKRFASPLNFNPNMTCYFSMYAEDALFGANFDAYSVKWTGASQVNPEYEAVAMEKAMSCTPT